MVLSLCDLFVFVADYWTADFSGHAVKSEEISFQQSWSSVCGKPSVAIATTFMITSHFFLLFVIVVIIFIINYFYELLCNLSS